MESKLRKTIFETVGITAQKLFDEGLVDANIEQELKYRMNGQHILGDIAIEDIIAVLEKQGYHVVDGPFVRSKIDQYFDDEKQTLFLNGDALRRKGERIMYKKNLQIINGAKTPYVERLELLSDKLGNIVEFSKAIGLHIVPRKEPILTADIARDKVFMCKDDAQFAITHDRTTYTNLNGVLVPIIEEIEVESKDSNQEDGDVRLREINKHLLNSGLGIEVSKQSKYERGVVLDKTL